MKGAEPWRVLCTFTTYLHPLLLIQTSCLWSVYAFVKGQIGVCVCVCVCMCVCVCVCVWKTLHASDVIIFTQVHIHTHKYPQEVSSCAHASTHSHTHTDGKLNGKILLSPIDMLSKLHLRPFFFFHLLYLKWQCKCSDYTIVFFKMGNLEKSLKIYSSSINNMTLLKNVSQILKYLYVSHCTLPAQHQRVTKVSD